MDYKEGAMSSWVVQSGGSSVCNGFLGLGKN
jgi:hypothetical protein